MMDWLVNLPGSPEAWAGLYLLCGLGMAFLLFRSWRRPVDEAEERYAQIDDELSARENGWVLQLARERREAAAERRQRLEARRIVRDERRVRAALAPRTGRVQASPRRRGDL